MINLTVKDQMSQPLVSIDINLSLRDAATEMVKKDIGSLLITQEGASVGIVTERDIVRSLAKGNEDTSLEDSMGHPLITISVDATLGEAAQVMMTKKIRRLAVKDVDGSVVGLINMRDVITAVHESFLAIFDA